MTANIRMVLIIIGFVYLFRAIERGDYTYNILAVIFFAAAHFIN